MQLIVAFLLLACAASEKPNEFLVKVVVPTYSKTVKSYEHLVTILCAKKVREVKDFDELPIKLKTDVQKNLKELTSLGHKVCFDVNKFMKRSREEENSESAKTDKLRSKLREQDLKKASLKSSKDVIRDKVRMAKTKKVQMQNKLQLKTEELDETNRKMEQSRCRRKRGSDEKKKKAEAKNADKTAAMGGLKAIRCQFDSMIRKKQKQLKDEVGSLKKALKKLKKDEANVERESADAKTKLEQERKEIDKVEKSKETLKVNTSGAEAELRKSKLLLDDIRALQGHLQNVHDGITRDVKVIDRDLPVIVLAMKKINIALMSFNTEGVGKIKLPHLKKLETFADQAEKDNAKQSAKSKDQ